MRLAWDEEFILNAHRTRINWKHVVSRPIHDGSKFSYILGSRYTPSVREMPLRGEDQARHQHGDCCQQVKGHRGCAVAKVAGATVLARGDLRNGATVVQASVYGHVGTLADITFNPGEFSVAFHALSIAGLNGRLSRRVLLVKRVVTPRVEGRGDGTSAGVASNSVRSSHTDGERQH